MNLVGTLREDLRLFAAAPNRDGSPAWTIQDPVTNRFFRIGWLEFEVLSRWTLLDPKRIAQSVAHDTGLAAQTEHVLMLNRFFEANHLLRVADAAGTARLAAERERQRGSKLSWLLHNYLFFRIPLLRPGQFFERTAPLLAWVYTRAFAWCVIIAALLGLMLAARQWDEFAHTFVDFLTPQGLVGYGLALTFAKTLHELGHAYTATRYGVRVAHMGVAFLVMWPMLYTDTSESWKLAERAQRFRIAAAGMAAEFSLAAFATLGWSITADGPLRSALFFLATTSWLITVGINASPFMRFDGYFLLSDALDIPNLHARSFALARAWLRRLLLGWREADPENLPARLRRGMLGFALITWMYRLVVFLGIAVAVYYFFFKVLGIFLFLVELAWFIARPIWSELQVWIKRWREIRLARVIWPAALLAAGVALLFVPLRYDVRAEAWIHAEQQQIIYSPLPARVSSVRGAGEVKAREVLALLDSPDTRSKANQSEILAAALALQLNQTIGRADGAEKRLIIAEQLAQQRAELQAQRDELQRLELRAPFSGQLLDVDNEIQKGSWINASQPIAILIDPHSWIIEAFVEQDMIGRFDVGDQARVYLRGSIEPPLSAKVISIDSTRALAFPHQMLAADHGGRLAANKPTTAGPQAGQLVPRDALYRVRLAPDDAALARIPHTMSLATVHIDGRERTLAGAGLQRIAALIVRESGF